MVPGSPPSFLRALTKEGGVPSASPLPPRRGLAPLHTPWPPLIHKSIYSLSGWPELGFGGPPGPRHPLSRHLHLAGSSEPLLRVTPHPPVSASRPLHPAPHFLKHFLDLFPLFLLKDSLYRDIERDIYKISFFSEEPATVWGNVAKI